MKDMVKLTDCKTLEEYCEKKREYYEYQDWSTASCTIEFYNEAGIFDIKDAQKWELYGIYSDFFKDAYGHRPRFDFLLYTIEELEYEVQEIIRIAGEVAQEERKAEREIWVNLRQKICDRAKYFDISLKQALEEDIIDADVMYGDTGKVDLGYYCFTRRIPYGKYKVLARVLEQQTTHKKYVDKIVTINV